MPYTIANLYYGHTHNDQKLLLTLMPNHQNQINQSPLLGSFNHLLHLVTITQHFRYYEVEDESFNIMNSFNYYTKLNETYVNGGEEPVWEYEYSARAAYDPNNEVAS